MNIADIEAHVRMKLTEALEAAGLGEAPVQLGSPPRAEMGDYALACFPFARLARKAPAAIAADVAAHIETDDVIEAVEAAGPYVNVRVRPAARAYAAVGEALSKGADFGFEPVPTEAAQTVMVEFSSPNTNKPQHLGHVRNNLLGACVSRLLERRGHRVIRANLVNDRGIHICKSMLAYQRWGQGVTPETAGKKGDHLVGDFYVLFETKFREEYAQWLQSPQAREAFAAWLETPDGRAAARQAGGADSPRTWDAFAAAYKQTYFNEHSELGAAAREMLRKWEAGDEDVRALWRTMNRWVLDGFEATYRRLGVRFDRIYFESDTWVLGRKVVEEGLERGVFTRREDGAVLFDLSKIGMKGFKVVLRADGTTVYITQDLGTALARFDEYDLDRMIYVVGEEQEYHFKVLFGILGVLRPALREACYHLSYGMVLLPEGKMKSREGTVVDADDLMDEMHALARAEIEARSPDATAEDVEERAERIGLAALKYYLLRFTPRATITFDPRKSIDFLGQTGPYLLYAYARIQNLFRKAGRRPQASQWTPQIAARLDTPLEQAVIRELIAFPQTAVHAADTLDPAKVAEGVFRVARAFNALYTDPAHQIVGLDDRAKEDARLALAAAVSACIASGLDALCIDLVDRM